jgi:hypothetical protein
MDVLEKDGVTIRKRPPPPGFGAAARANWPAGGPEMAVEYLPADTLRLPKRQLRKHSPQQVSRIAMSIKEFGITRPILVDRGNQIIAGVAVYRAAVEIGITRIPVIRHEHMTKEQVRLYTIADNKLAEMSEFDFGALATELGELEIAGFDLSLTGFETFELDRLLMAPPPRAADAAAAAEEVPEPSGQVVSEVGDLWRLGPHRMLCGDARDHASYLALMGDERARMICSDVPYNCKIPGNVSGLGKVKHSNFLMSSGEMSREEFTAFLTAVFAQMAHFSLEGAIHFLFMDWRHQVEMMTAGETVYDELKNVLVWNKLSGGMGTFYRSQHELIYAWKKGKAKHVNNFGLGDKGRYRTNVIDMPGANSFSHTRTEDLAAHSTVKPTPLIVDLLRDVSHRGDIVLDPFCGSGTTILAATRTGRHARCIELDPKYVDVAIRRWEKRTGQKAIHSATGLSFEALAQARGISLNKED